MTFTADQMLQIVRAGVRADTKPTSTAPEPTGGVSDLVGKRVLVRTHISGVSIGLATAVTVSPNLIVRLNDAWRIWSWEGAFTVSEIATAGVSSARVARHPDGVVIVDAGGEIHRIDDDAWDRIMANKVEGAR